MILDKFFVKLGYEYDPEKMEKFNKGVKATLGFVKKLSIAAIGLATSFALLYARIANKGLGQQRLGAALKVTRQELEGIQRVANELTGDRGGADRLLETFSNFGTKLNQGLISGEVQEALVRLRLNPSDLSQLSTKEIISELAKAYQLANQNTRNIVDLNLGNGANEINFLKGFNEKLFNQLKPTIESFKNIEKINNILSRSLNAFNDEILKVGNLISDRLLPAFEDLQKVIPDIASAIGKALNFFLDIGEGLGKGIFKIFNAKGIGDLASGFADVTGISTIGKGLGLSGTPSVFNFNVENNISSNNPQFISGAITDSIVNKYNKISKKNPLRLK